MRKTEVQKVRKTHKPRAQHGIAGIIVDVQAEKSQEWLRAMPKASGSNTPMFPVTLRLELSAYSIGNAVTIAGLSGHTIEEVLSAALNNTGGLCDMVNNADDVEKMEGYGL